MKSMEAGGGGARDGAACAGGTAGGCTTPPSFESKAFAKLRKVVDTINTANYLAQLVLDHKAMGALGIPSELT
jgi:hypothetical protein